MSSGVDWYHSSLLAKTGSISKTTPRKPNMRWRTTSPIEKRADETGGAEISRPACGEKKLARSMPKDIGFRRGENKPLANKGSSQRPPVEKAFRFLLGKPVCMR